MASKYQRLAASERAVLAAAFAPEQDEKRGGHYGVEWGRKRPLDQGGTRLRGAVHVDHSVSRLHGHGNTGGYTTKNFGVPDSYVGPRMLNSGITRPAYRPEQTSYRKPVAGAGRSAGPAWASTSRVRANSAYEYAWDPKGDHNYGYPNRRGPF
jgi:hypothetical protein